TGLFGGGDDPAKQPPVAVSSGPAKADFPVEAFTHPGGITVNVPKGWTQKQLGVASAPYFDITDTGDSNRRIRVNIEKAAGTPRSFLESAENRLKSTPASCAPPYARVDLTDNKLDAKDAALLEYTCGSGDQQRHALWNAVVVGGKSYHFFVTVPE